MARGSRKNHGGVARRHLQRTQSQLAPDELDPGNGKPQIPFIPPKEYEIRWDREQVASWLRGWEAKGYLKLRPEKLKWSPFLLARTATKKTEGIAGQSDNVDVEGTSTNGLQTTNSASTTPGAGPSTSLAHSLFMALEDAGGRVSNTPPASAQADEPGVLPNQFAVDSTPSARQLRNRSTPSGSTPVTNHTRSNSVLRNSNDTRMAPKTPESVVDDEALAARLTAEERRSTRSLRSRPDAGQLKRNVSSTSNSKSASPRKRRRVVESSPEVSPTPRRKTTPAVNGNGLQSSDSSQSGEVSVSPRRYERKSNRLLNGQENGNASDHVNGMDEPHSDLSPVLNVETLIPSVPTIKTITAAFSADVRDDNGCDVKAEDLDLGSPLTGITSRQSEPSDGTIGVDSLLPPNGKGADKVHAKIVARLS